jgi:hypothetical protein
MRHNHKKPRALLSMHTQSPENGQHEKKIVRINKNLPFTKQIENDY